MCCCSWKHPKSPRALSSAAQRLHKGCEWSIAYNEALAEALTYNVEGVELRRTSTLPGCS